MVRRRRTRKLWTDKDETTFIKIWQKNLPDLQSDRKNIEVYKEMVEQLQEHDVTITPCEVKSKMENLKRKYCYEKTKVGSSDDCDWKHFKRMESLVGSSCAQRLTYAEDESSDNSNLDADLTARERVTRVAKPITTASGLTKEGCDPFKNKVNKFRKPGKIWSPKEENILIYFWQENLTALQSDRKNMDVYREMVVQLHEYDVMATPCEIKSKLETLKKKYSLEKTKIGKNDVSDWEHFTIVEYLVGASCSQRSGNEKFNSDSDSTGHGPVTRVAKPIPTSPVKPTCDSLTTEVNKFRKPGKIWSPKEENALIYLWQENLPAFKSERKNMDVYREMVEQLREYDVTATPSEIKSKLEALKRRYCLVKRKSENSDDCEWEHFKIVEYLVNASRSQRTASENGRIDTDSDSTACNPKTRISDPVPRVAKPTSTPCSQPSSDCDLLTNDCEPIKAELNGCQMDDTTNKLRKPSKIWSPKEENVLIRLWQKHLSEFEGERKNIDIYKEMVEEFLEQDITITAREMKSKMEALKKKYSKEKALVGRSGVSHWQNFEKMHSLCESSTTEHSKSHLEENTVCDDFDTSPPDLSKVVNESVEEMSDSGKPVVSQSPTVSQSSNSEKVRTDSTARQTEHSATVAYIKNLLCSLPYNVAEKLAFDFIAKCQGEILKHSKSAD